MNFTIDTEFSKLIPPLRPEEFEQLKENIIAEGCRDPLVIWGEEKLLLDGHNRLRICEENKISYHVKYVPLQGREAALDWIDRNQLGRRNLTAEQVSLIRGRVYERTKKAEGRPSAKLAQSDPVSTAETLAKQYGVSPATIKRDGQFAAAVEQLRDVVPDIEDRVTRGEVTSKAGIVEAAKILKPHVTNNSGNNEWYTPPYIIEAARQAMGSIDCDPASSEAANKNVKAVVYYTAEEDGLKQKWSGNIWLNPPYAKGLVGDFASAVVERYASGSFAAACVLVNNATETEWFGKMLNKSAAACFLSGRIKYLDQNNKPANTPLQGQALLYFGDDIDSFKAAFSGLGEVLKHA